jgi:hypothetical protein
VNDIWWNIFSKFRLFADDCIIYRKILNIKDVEKLQKDLDGFVDWAEGNENKSEYKQGTKLHESPGEGSAKLLPWGPKDS